MQTKLVIYMKLKLFIGILIQDKILEMEISILLMNGLYVASLSRPFVPHHLGGNSTGLSCVHLPSCSSSVAHRLGRWEYADGRFPSEHFFFVLAQISQFFSCFSELIFLFLAKCLF